MKVEIVQKLQPAGIPDDLEDIAPLCSGGVKRQLPWSAQFNKHASNSNVVIFIDQNAILSAILKWMNIFIVAKYIIIKWRCYILIILCLQYLLSLLTGMVSPENRSWDGMAITFN